MKSSLKVTILEVMSPKNYGEVPTLYFITILNVPALFSHPRTKYMLAPGLLQIGQFEQLATILTRA